MPVPNPAPVYRILHIDNLSVCLNRRGIYAPNFTPNDGLNYRTIHNVDIQNHRRTMCLNCGPCGTVHDYVAFYFGYLSPMLFQLNTERVEGILKVRHLLSILCPRFRTSAKQVWILSSPTVTELLLTQSGTMIWQT